jgi:hypothetical protein
MEGEGNRLILATVACVAGLLALSEARAQSTAVAGYPTSTSTSPAMGMGMGMGMGFMPYGMFGTTSPSATDAAALGMTGQSTGGMGMGGQTNNMFANPMLAPMLYGTASGMGQRQLGLMMLAGQSQMLGGIGSGQMSGVRPGVGGQSKGRTAQKTAAKPPGSAGRPGGLAARYFNRTTPVTRYPQSYYNRQSRYFPQVTR